MYTLLHEEDFSFRFGRRLKLGKQRAFAVAAYDSKKRGKLVTDIVIDPTARIEGGIIALAFHELIHELYWELSEQETTVLEKKMLRVLSTRQLRNFLKRIVSLM